MPPTTQRRPQVTPAGVSARNSIAEVRQNVNNGATPAQARQTLAEIKTGSLRPTVPDVIPSTALAGNKTFEDVMDRRADLETEATAKNQLNQRFTDLTTRVNTNTPSTFANPDDMINRLLLNRAPSSTELQRNETATRNIENRRDFAGDIATAREKANTEFGLPDLTAKLADTRTQYAEREQRLNNDIKRYEENALKRGVPREFVEAEKNKLKSDALEDLSNLAAIETAQAGSIQEARNIINDTINDKKAAFELENQAIEQEINYLNTLVGEENAQQAQQLQFALNERKTMQERQLAQETEIKEYMVEAASNGADQGTIQAIINAKSPEEAFRYAAPFVGLLDRRAMNLREAEFALSRDKFESKSDTFNSGVVTIDGEKNIVTNDGRVTPISKMDFNDPAQVDALPVGMLTKAVMNGFTKTKDLTPTQKGQVISELQAIGFNPNTYVVNKLNSLVETWAAMPEDSRGYVEGLKFWESKTRPEVATFESQRQLLTREIARLFDVGVLSDQDVTAYTDAMPSRRDGSIDVVISKTAGIAGAAAGTNPENAGRRIRMTDGREAIVATDGETLLDPVTGKPLE